MGGRAWHRRHLMEAHGFALPDGTWQQLPSLPTEVFLWKPVEGEVPPRFECTEICVANVDTLTAALVLGDACALNFANACTPGGRYRSGGRAQEEDLCRLLPQLYDSLKCAEYPIAPHTALLTRYLLAVRCPGTYERRESVGACTIISAAMPCGIANQRQAGGWAKSPWARTVTERIRAVLCAAQTSGHPHLVLGAFLCGVVLLGTLPGLWQQFSERSWPLPVFVAPLLASSSRFWTQWALAILDPSTGKSASLRGAPDTGPLDQHAKVTTQPRRVTRTKLK